jgi:hypothetical protein
MVDLNLECSTRAKRGIADWGVALSLLWNPHIPPPAKNLAEGAAALAKAKSIGAGGHRSRWGYTADVADGSIASV